VISGGENPTDGAGRSKASASFLKKSKKLCHAVARSIQQYTP
jgi:hypothetical protein